MESEVIHVLCAFAKWAMNEKRWRKKWERERAQRKSVYIVYMIYREACTLHTAQTTFKQVADEKVECDNALEQVQSIAINGELSASLFGVRVCVCVSRR